MNRLLLIRAAGVNLLLISALASQSAQREPQLHAPPPKASSAYDTPLTGYEVALITAEFIVNMERGLSEAFQKPLSTASAGTIRLAGRHPAWVRPALRELKARGAIPPRFSASQPMPRYQVGQMLAQYAQRLDARMREQVGAPRGVTRFRTQPTLQLKRSHPAYRALQYLAQGGWVGAGSPLYQKPTEPVLGKELPDMLRDLARRILERYRDEPHLEN
ncbi:MAG: hypothetical protein KatS3mg020_0465 [Fimbriimonadales bacterium]|nr:MAG: hypothetical protein KatS3mg019_1174 [Fimbriimonadales bacterium]GIV10007.1 MAG: hypothetical protein KatS3mg019_2098 [Fimbriimonadales bacterium]GIV10974.1 MAG: hypothetical protein KatS3mg020_0465 [Fimbriimonadales bacterium]